MATDVNRHALRLAANRLGGNVQLREFLDVPRGQLLRWMTGMEPLPRPVYLKLVGVILEGSGRIPQHL